MENLQNADAKIALTVLVLCGNEENNIGLCLDTAKWASELLVVVDDSSVDRTEEIALQYTSRVLRHKYENYATQQNWAIPQASNEWVLVLDADERITQSLQCEIDALLKSTVVHDGYWLRRANYLLGKEVQYSGWGNEKVLRLFRRDKARYQNKRVHAKAEIENTGELQGRIIHYSINSFHAWIAKINRYSTWKSLDKFEKRSRFPYIQLLLRPPYRFFKDYALRRGVLDGWRGFMIATMSAFSEFIMSAKLIEQYWALDRSAAKCSDKEPGLN
jgi:hypothetical protein